MLRPIALAVIVAAPAAFASEERIAVVGNDPGAAQVRESVCISEECVDARANKLTAIVHARQVKNKLEVSVQSPDGAVRFTKSAPVGEGGLVGSTDLVSLTTAVVHAIEYPGEASKEAKDAKEAKGEKHASAKKAKTSKRLAARKSAKSAAHG